MSSSFRLSGSISHTVGMKHAIPIVKCILSFSSTPFEVNQSVLREFLGGVGNVAAGLEMLLFNNLGQVH